MFGFSMPLAPIQGAEQFVGRCPGHRFAQPWAGFWRLVELLSQRVALDHGFGGAIQLHFHSLRCFAFFAACVSAR